MVLTSLFKKRHIGYQIHDFFNARVGGFFIKLYCSIISGVWSIVLLLPLEGFLSYKFGSEPFQHYASRGYFFFFLLFTAFFVLSSALLPRIKCFHIKRILKHSLSRLPLTPCQRVNFLKDKEKRRGFRAFFTPEGLLTFFRYNIVKNIEYTSLYFSLESLIHALNVGNIGGVYVSLCFIFVYGIAYFFSDWLNKRAFTRSSEFDEKMLDEERRKELILKSVAEILDADGLGSSQVSNLRENVKSVVEMIEINLMFKHFDKVAPKHDASDVQVTTGTPRSFKRLAARSGA